MIDSFAHVDPALVDQPLDPSWLTDGHSGYTPELQANDTPDAMRSACGASGREFHKSMWIERKDRAEKVRDNDKNRTWGLNYLDRFTNQQPTHECTCHSLRANFEGAWNFARGIIYEDGPKKDYRYEDSKKGSVWVSPLSVYAEANPRQWGGAMVIEVLNIACRRGFLPDKIQPNDGYKLKHSLQGTTGKGNNNQSSGSWVPLSRFPEDWEKTAALLKPEEVVVTRDWEEALCLILNSRIFSVGRDGHAIPYTHWNEKDQLAGYVDSYNVVRYDSLRTFQKAVSYGGFSIISTTMPDDWTNPAGNAA